MDTEKKLALIMAALEEHQGLDIRVLDVKEKTSVCDYFVICSGKSAPQIKTLCDCVEEAVESISEPPRRIDGYSDARWIVVDCADIIVHVFKDDMRLFYHIEKLWEDKVQ